MFFYYRRRGKRRASLPKLLAANSPELIQSTTASAFAHLTSLHAAAPSTEAILGAVKILVDAIKGVGPATASYILALIAPAHVPVFSDEGFRWMLHANGDGWHAGIKYDLKEYRAYLDLVQTLASRLGDGVTAEEVEKVGFVLGKEAAAELKVGSGGGGGGSAAAAKTQIVVSKNKKKLTGADALDTALGVAETNTVPASPAPALPPAAPPAGVQSPATTTLGLMIPVTRTVKASKRKKPDTDTGDDVEKDDVPLPRSSSRKVRVGSEPKRGAKKTGKK